ncbi:VF530 family protein [Sulfurovum sp.]|uniref:VF530 family protein n=1 Tax=Sulfurovum sp. TaxID=1969726 RepID=UPI0025E3782B|nr:VF530 family protein [Sulfurovum sp.]
MKKNEHRNNPLHGINLKQIPDELVDLFGWEVFGECINICYFKQDPSISSCLKFLRRTPWARTKVEILYLRTIVK